METSDPAPQQTGILVRWIGLLTTAALFAVAIVFGWQQISTTHPVAVTGLISVNGTPLKSGVVNFRPVDPLRGSYAMGLIGKDGRYSAETPHFGPGMLPGIYRVGVLSQEDPTRYTPEEYAELVGIGKPGLPSVVPPPFTDPMTSNLTVTIIAPGPQTYDLNLDGAAEQPGR